MANIEVDVRFNSNYETDCAERERLRQQRLIFDTRFCRCCRTLHLIASRILGGTERADEAIESCWRRASRHPPRSEHEGEFHRWLLRVLIDEALTLLSADPSTPGLRKLRGPAPAPVLPSNCESDGEATIAMTTRNSSQHVFIWLWNFEPKALYPGKDNFQMNEPSKFEASYFLGHSDAETLRLQTQAEILQPITKRLLQSAGIQPGMRVLDLGTGAGDAAMLAAELVGPSGAVVGVDRNSQILSIARERANRAGFRHLSYYEAPVETFVDDSGFDLVVGRYVLIHQNDPVAFLRAAARLTRPGGSMALHEIRLSELCRGVPNVPLLEMIDKLMCLAFSSALPHYDAADKLIEHFAHAGLPEPSLFCETHVWGAADAPYYAWMVDGLRALLPQLKHLGIIAADFMEIETLESRIRDAVRRAHSQVRGAPQVCAWTRT
jgi:ubiquinone/menaquinone biosynthesis C-methylase UbiE